MLGCLEGVGPRVVLVGAPLAASDRSNPCWAALLAFQAMGAGLVFTMTILFQRFCHLKRKDGSCLLGSS